MKILTNEVKDNIQRKIFNRGRDIDVALINVLFDDMPNDFILDALMFYQTKDGGFGGGLYIDNYNPNTSVYQIYEAYRILDMAGFDSSCESELFDKMINKSMNYLYNRETLVKNKWNPNVKSNNDFAHSAIFDYTTDFVAFNYAPTAAILGYTFLYCKPTKAYYKKALKMTEVMIKDFIEMESLNKFEFISFNIFLNCIKRCNLFISEQKLIEEKLTKLAKELVSLEFSDSSKVHPLDCALYLNDSELSQMKEQQLDYIIDSIEPHGLWEKKDSWGHNKYAEEDSAKLKWIGAQSVNNVYFLKLHNRVE